MIRKRFFAWASTLAVALTLFAGSTATVLAKDPFGGIDCAKAPNSAVCSGKSNSTANPLTGPNGIIRKATVLVARIAGVAAVIIIMIGGFMYITANGDSGKITEAKNTIIYASVGLIVIVSAQTIIIFVLSKL